MKELIKIDFIERRISIIRGQKVMLDRDLADLYGVSTARLNEQIKRNKSRFPDDFMFQLNRAEFKNLMSQFATSSARHGGYRKLPYAFTEHGAVAAAFVLNSPVAVTASIQIVRVFNRLRQLVNTHKDLALALAKLEKIEHQVTGHDEQIQSLFDTIREILTQPEDPPKQIGFRVPDETGQG